MMKTLNRLSSFACLLVMSACVQVPEPSDDGTSRTNVVAALNDTMRNATRKDQGEDVVAFAQADEASENGIVKETLDGSSKAGPKQLR